MDQSENGQDINQFLETNYKCPKHTNKMIEWIKLVEDSDQQVLKCSKCIDKKTDFLNCLFIEELMESNSETIFERWPFLNNPEILEKLKETTSRISEVNQIKDKIRTIFKNLWIKIDQKLEEKQEEIFKFIDKQKSAQQEYNLICQKEKLNDIIRNMHQDFEKQNLMLKDIIAENNINYEKNQQTLVNYINNFQEIINIDFSAYNEIENSLCKSIDDINWQPLKENVQVFQAQNQSLRQKQQVEIIQNDVKLPNEEAKQNKDESEELPFKVRNLDDLSNCVDKRHLDIDFSQSQIEVGLFQSIASVLENFQNVSCLNLNLQELSQYNFHNYSLGQEGFMEILNAIQTCQNITELSLSLSNSFPKISSGGLFSVSQKSTFTSQEAKNLVNTLSMLQKSTDISIDLSDNLVGDDSAKEIAQGLEKCTKITSLNLNLGKNFISPYAANMIIFALQKCKNISKLKINLSYNSLSEESVNSIKSILERSQQFTNLEIDLKQRNQPGLFGGQIEC